MTQQPPEHHDGHADHAGCDHATPEQRLARAHRANDLVNALITSRDNLPQAAQIIESTINEFGEIDAEETIRMIANALIGFTNRIHYYARIMDKLSGDADTFDRYHADAVLLQQIDPTVRRIDHHEGEA